MRRIERSSRVLISGSSGLLGRALTETLTISGHTAVPLQRGQRKTEDGRPWWNPATGPLHLTGIHDGGFLDEIHGTPSG